MIRIRHLVKDQLKGNKQIQNDTFKGSPTRSAQKRRTADVEFRDMTNAWIEDTLQNIENRRGYDKYNPKNMVYTLSSFWLSTYLGILVLVQTSCY